MFFKQPSSFRKSKSGLYFCNKKCKDEAQSIGGIVDIQPSHYKNGAYAKYGEKKKDIQSCERCGYNLHPEILQVHHSDRNRFNNKIENLEKLCPNCHLWEHYQRGDGLFTFHRK